MIPKLALAFYGDDFTGSTDVMEVLTWAGLPTVLFLKTPTPEALARFPEARAIGIAGDARSRSPEWMFDNLPAVFDRLKSFGAPLNQYKVCSTFDSSPRVGSIGSALELGLTAFDAAWAPIVVGAPKLRRYQAFGNLFARVGPTTYRIDRHPTMSRHPVTPMNEGDLRLHLAEQTDMPIGLVDLLALQAGEGQAALDAAAGEHRGILFDVINERTLAAAGQLVWENREAAPFSVSSSGLEYALVAHWRSAGLLPESAPLPPPEPVDRIAVISGSCSPETAASIRCGLDEGYGGVRLDPRSVASGEIDEPLRQAVEIAASGRSFILYTALGPDDPQLVDGDEDLRRDLADQLGRLFAAALEQTGIRRAVVCGGDTSSGVGARLGIEAVTAVSPLAPGSPLCRARTEGPLNGLEIMFKGGQVGGERIFEETRGR